MSACILVFSFFSFAAAGENCAMQGGKCRNACGSDETAEAGAFDDCEEKQECCVVQDTAGKINCCVLSFGTKNYGKLNCGSPSGGICLKGSGSPALCAQLAACKQP
jgi:hypothetical protein